MAEETFKLPGSSYEELCKIIQGYGKLSKPSPLEEVSQITKIHTTAISRSNGFLMTAGIIEGGKFKGPTSFGRKLALALDFERGDEISSAWRDIVKANEFLSKMLAAIRIRKGMDTGAFQSHIAYSAGQPRNKNIMAGANAIVDILKSAELISEQDGQLVSMTPIPESMSMDRSSGGTEALDPQSTAISGIEVAADNVNYSIGMPSATNSVVINIEIRIDVKPNELEGLGAKLRSLIEEMKQGGTKKVETDGTD